MASKAQGAEKDEFDVKGLNQDPEKIKMLMKRDPKFIERLITQLDKNMHKMMLQKKAKLDEIAQAEKEIETINSQIKSHITPNLERLEGSIKSKRELRDQVKQQCDAEFAKVKDLEAEARALIQKSRHTAGKLYRATATQRMEEARGFSSSTPTTTLLKGGAATATLGATGAAGRSTMSTTAAAKPST
ncbi:hypothetical protein CHLRE_14g617250v5 [Chlamydomonas reinhardtii]|uniref:Uncharacterized protein n=1 Tax=Chlamydomonas reinhardtii TaxID=3055 RepID=A8HNU2_CHLRE|nr:uncharacterized protein CHLRE_14g617250v5 [Chlamydomonas reinhardtii]PNW73060.1 hypothetical protein CHLRE_14g617250v5 [Chlamydomonas reinhardtii]|eukprot:XP_001689819.1 flagellar associated protein [Chlamydomonas reinhardtii]